VKYLNGDYCNYFKTRHGREEIEEQRLFAGLRDFILDLPTNLRTLLKKTEFLTPSINITSTLSWIPVRIFSSSSFVSAVEPTGIPGTWTTFLELKNSPLFTTQYTSSSSAQKKNNNVSFSNAIAV